MASPRLDRTNSMNSSGGGGKRQTLMMGASTDALGQLTPPPPHSFPHLAHGSSTNLGKHDNKKVTIVEKKNYLFQKVSRDVVESRYFIVFVSTLTLYALVGDDIRVLSTDKPADDWFNAMTILCIIFFSFEILLSCAGKDDYFLSFFFLLDMVATVTLFLDLTWISEQLMNENSVGEAKASRTARLGARVGSRVLRLMRIVKLYKAIYEARKERLRRLEEKKLRETRGMLDGDDDDAWLDEDLKAKSNLAKSVDKGTRVGKKLSELTIRRVIILVLVMMFVNPLLVPDKEELPLTATFGADLVTQAFQRMMNATEISGITGVFTEAPTHEWLRLDYERELLRFVYYHNWFTGRTAECPNGNWCSQFDYANAFWIGIASNSKSQVMDFAKHAEVRNSTFEAWRSEHAVNENNIYVYGEMPSKVNVVLKSRWNQWCPNTQQTGPFYRFGFSLIAEYVNGEEAPFVENSYQARCPDDLRAIERDLYTSQLRTKSDHDAWQFIFYFDRRRYARDEASSNLILTAFVCVCLCTASLFFTNDANELVLYPVEKMVRKVDVIRDEPLKAIRMADDEFKAEEAARSVERRRREKKRKQKWNQLTVEDLYKTFCGNTRKSEPMETVILEKTIIKLGSLLALGFGEAGANIIGQNMQGESAGIDAMGSGTPVDCIIGCTRICNFSTATEVLQGKVMTFVNQIAEIVHGVVNEFSGAVNKNNGETFLIIWRLVDLSPCKIMKQADMAVLAVSKMLAAIHRSPVLSEYRKHPGLQLRLRTAERCRVNLRSGVHAGWAIEGAVGSEFKIDPSYLSPNVSTAETLELLTPIYNVNILVSQNVLELCTPSMAAKCRLVDRVIFPGYHGFMELYVIDLDHMQLEVEPYLEHKRPFNTRQRFKARQQLELEKNEKWSDDVTMVKIFHTSEDILAMRCPFTVEFICVFNMGFQNYAEGEWQVARRLLETTRVMLNVEDGPSLALLAYMEKFNFKAPSEWHGVREMTREEIDHDH